MTLQIPIQEIGEKVGSGSEIAESMVINTRETLMDEKVYVAVTGKDLESKSSLVWAIQNSGGKEFCIVHVHQPIQISVPGTMFHDQNLRLYRKEKEKAHKNLDKYLQICKKMQVTAEIIYIELDSVEEGILQLFSKRGVRKLVMGAAAERHYSMRMRDLRSKKAIYIHREAPSSCHIWFTCNGYLICSREAKTRDNLYLECASSNSLSQVTRGTGGVPSSSMVKDNDPIQVAVPEDENWKREALKKAKQWETVYFKELKRRKETEKALRIAKEELEKMRSESETQIAESNVVIRNVQEKYSLSVEALRKLREEQEELKIELRNSKRGEEESSPFKHREAPHYFICPITQEIMEDPHIAADGFTYEREAISGWVERGYETSPMTNRWLPHTSLVPNLALRSAIQEWLQARESLYK